VNRVNSILNQFHLMERVERMVGDANKTNIEGDLDFVFIDGDHSYEEPGLIHNMESMCKGFGGYVILTIWLCRPYATQLESLEKLREKSYPAEVTA